MRLGRAGVALALLALAEPAAAQATRAERTGYRETSTHADVLAFLDTLRQRGAGIVVDTLAVSPRWRVVPWVLAARPLPRSAADARRSGRPIVYLQANIHGGEVEGKEAALMLLRDLTLDSLRPLLDNLVLLVVPIYNADGNDSLGPTGEHRPGQHGPDIVGRRANGAGLDLNRDYVKMEAPETRGAARLLLEWDPDLFVDLHTTNGSYHGYALTFATGLDPNPSPATEFARSTFLPVVRERMTRRHRLPTFWYGNFRNQDPDSLAQGWETYDPRPRFGTNWAGMRNRIAVLSEAYSNHDFRTRVATTYAFVREVLSLAAERRETVREVVGVSRVPPESISVRAALGPPAMQEVIAELTSPAGQGAGGYARRQRTGVYRRIRMPVYDRFVPARREAMPAAYILPAGLERVAVLLRRHGIEVHRLPGWWAGPVERFTLERVQRGEPYEGHRPVRLEGRWGAPEHGMVRAGWLAVGTDQPLGILAAYLLEPASDDGVATWELVNPLPRAGDPYPIIRTREPVHRKGDPLP